MPLTSPMRALLDTAAVATRVVPDALVNASREAVHATGIEAEIERAAVQCKPGSSGARALSSWALAVDQTSSSDARKVFRDAGYRPRWNSSFRRRLRPRLYWPEAGLVFEVTAVASLDPTALCSTTETNRVVIGTTGSAGRLVRHHCDVTERPQSFSRRIGRGRATAVTILRIGFGVVL